MLVGLLAGIGREGAAVRHAMPGLQAVPLLGWLIDIPIAAFFQAGATRLSLRAMRGEPYAFGDVFDAGRYLAPAVGALFLSIIVIEIGMLFLVIPGIIAATGLWLAMPLVIDRNLGAIDALKESWRLTQGHKFGIFVAFLLLLLCYVLGLCACCVGALIATPLYHLAQAYVYLRISGQPVAPVVRAA